MPIYYAIVETANTANRLANLTQALATMEAYSIDASARTATELAGTVYWTNLFTGCYLVSVSDDTDGLSVVFRLLVHADDQAEFADCAALHMREIPAAITAQTTALQGADGDTLETLSDQMDGVPAATHLLIGSSQITLSSPVIDDGDTVEVYPGEDYYYAEGRQWSWSSEGWPDLTGATVKMKTVQMSDITCTVVDAGETEQTIYAEVSSTESAKITANDYTGYIWVEADNTHEFSIVQKFSIVKKTTRS